MKKELKKGDAFSENVVSVHLRCVLFEFQTGFGCVAQVNFELIMMSKMASKASLSLLSGGMTCVSHHTQLSSSIPETAKEARQRKSLTTEFDLNAALTFISSKKHPV